MNEYAAAPGAQFGSDKAQIYGQFIQEIIDRDGGISPELLVTEAAGSPLESFFEWNDVKAAHHYRVYQARHLLSHINVVLVGDSGPYQVRAFHYINAQVNRQEVTQKIITTRIYRNIEQILDSPDRDRLVEQILDQFICLRDKYYPYRELDEVFTAIDKVSKDLKGHPIKSERINST